jgi:hypothetical protein
MPPPNQSRRNPISSARAAVFDEQEEPRFFPLPGQRSAFAPYVSPSLLADTRLGTARFRNEFDELDTRRAENFTRRLESGSRARVLPFSESATIAEQRLQKEKAESDLRLNPFAESEAVAESKLQKAQADSSLQTLPEDVEARNLERDVATDRLRREDPEMEQLTRLTKNPRHLLAYEHFLETAPPEIKAPDARRKYARNQSLQIAQDEDSVASVYESYTNGELDETALDAFLEPVTGTNGEDFGMRVKNDPKVRARVRNIVAKNNARKEMLKRESDERQASRLENDSRIRAINGLMDDARKVLVTDATNAEALAELKDLKDQLKGLLGSGGGNGGQSSASPSAKPVDDSARTRLLR